MISKDNKRIIGYIILFTVFLFSLYITTDTGIMRYRPPPFEDPVQILAYLIGQFFVLISIEFIISYLFLRSRGINKGDLLFSIILINFVIYPPTQLIAYSIIVFNISYYPIYTIIIFLVGLATEWIFYLIQFQKLDYKNVMNNEFSSKKSVLISIVANLGSGSVVYILPSIVYIIEFIKWPGLYF